MYRAHGLPRYRPRQNQRQWRTGAQHCKRVTRGRRMLRRLCAYEAHHIIVAIALRQRAALGVSMKHNGLGGRRRKTRSRRKTGGVDNFLASTLLARSGAYRERSTNWRSINKRGGTHNA